MRIKSDGLFFAGLGGAPLFVVPNVMPTRDVREGWGDITLGAAYLLSKGLERGFDIELSGNVKIPTASAVVSYRLASSTIQAALRTRVRRALSRRKGL